MLHKPIVLLSLALLICSAPFAAARTHYTGQSGAPGQMSCASTCHGSGGGQITIDGFPELYEPEQTYEVTVSRSSGSNISNFNAACLVGSGSDNAGYFTAGQYTSTYEDPGTTNGVHFSNANHAQGTFSWTAPAAGTGDITFYLSGLQGSYSGANTDLVLTAAEGEEVLAQQTPLQFSIDSIYPNPFNPATAVEISLTRQTDVKLIAYNALGEKVSILHNGYLAAGTHRFNWSPGSIPAGIYFLKLEGAGEQLVSKICYLK